MTPLVARILSSENHIYRKNDSRFGGRFWISLIWPNARDRREVEYCFREQTLKYAYPGYEEVCSGAAIAAYEIQVARIVSRH